MNNYYEQIKKANRIVIKVGTSTLTHKSGKLNLRRMDQLAMTLSDMKNQGKEIVLVTSGAITAGVTKMGLKERPREIRLSQAAASVGQCELMFIYDKLFAQYGHIVSQILLTKEITEDEKFRQNIINAFETLLEHKVIPIINENDSVAIDEIVYGDNDMLSAVTASLLKADLLVILTDIDGLYDSNPQENIDARFIPVVEKIDESIEAVAGDSLSGVGTGGMITKINAARVAVESGVHVIIANGEHPEKLYDMLDGKPVGTIFAAKIQND